MHVKDIMCHTANRGSLGLNGYNVHRNGHEVDKIGVDMKELGKARRFEVCPLEPTKSAQVNFNARIVEKTKGLLADLSGSETKLSVGTGHYTAWVRAIRAGCRTPFKVMADSNGRLSADRFRNKDSRMRICLDVGWSWRILCWQVEVAWPGLPDLAQRALNSSHSVSSRSTELEVMVSLAEGSKEHKYDAEFEELVDAVALSGVPCAPYCRSVGKLAMQIGGGTSQQVLYFLDRFAKAFGENKALGEEFVNAVEGFSISKVDKTNYVRTAMVATNLVAEKVTDGIARLINKTDVDRMKTGDRKELALISDGYIKHVWATAENAMHSGIISEDDFDDFVGKFMVRIILFVCEKQKVGPEKREFKNRLAIQQGFCKDIVAIGGDSHIDLGGWAGLCAMPATERKNLPTCGQRRCRWESKTILSAFSVRMDSSSATM